MLRVVDVAKAADPPTPDEIAVFQAMATISTGESARPLDFLYFESDFSTAGNVSTSMANPDRSDFCGLTREQGQALVGTLIDVNARPVALDKSIAKPARLKLGQKKLPRFRYLMLSRVVFGPGKERAWLAVDLNGESGAIMRLDKSEGQWRKAARCGGWIRTE
jgi:hypothetical protein